MILEKHPVLLILALCFLRAVCDNDDASARRGTIDVSGSGRDFWPTETVANSAIRDPESGNPTSFLTSDDPESTESLASDDESESLTSTASYETTAEFQATDYSSSETKVTDGSSSSTVTQTTRFITTTLLPEDTTSADNTCDPLVWPKNASGN